jgi:hypothetical protein
MLTLRIALAFPTSASQAGNTTRTDQRYRGDSLANAELPPPSIAGLHLRIPDCFPHSDRSVRVGHTDAKWGQRADLISQAKSYRYDDSMGSVK